MLIDLIDKIFVNKKEQVFSLLSKYELDKFISTFHSKIMNLKKEDLAGEKMTLSSLASSFLTRVNSILENLTSNEEKKDLEYILSEISNEFIFQIIQKEDISITQVLTEIKDSIITTCDANNWNVEVLMKITKIDLLHALSVKSASPLTNTATTYKKNKPQVYYYGWLKSDLNEFSYNLKDQKIIKSIAEFKKLFTNHDGNIKIRMNGDQLEFIIILFDELKKNKFIKTFGTRGHFFPLTNYCVDFDKKELIKKPPKRIKELVSRDKAKHQQIMDKVNILLDLKKNNQKDL